MHVQIIERNWNRTELKKIKYSAQPPVPFAMQAMSSKRKKEISRW
jgi:hypothetical protein